MGNVLNFVRGGDANVIKWEEIVIYETSKELSVTVRNTKGIIETSKELSVMARNTKEISEIIPTKKKKKKSITVTSMYFPFLLHKTQHPSAPHAHHSLPVPPLISPLSS